MPSHVDDLRRRHMLAHSGQGQGMIPNSAIGSGGVADGFFAGTLAKEREVPRPSSGVALVVGKKVGFLAIDDSGLRMSPQQRSQGRRASLGRANDEEIRLQFHINHQGN